MKCPKNLLLISIFFSSACGTFVKTKKTEDPPAESTSSSLAVEPDTVSKYLLEDYIGSCNQGIGICSDFFMASGMTHYKATKQECEVKGFEWSIEKCDRSSVKSCSAETSNQPNYFIVLRSNFSYTDKIVFGTDKNDCRSLLKAYQ